MIDTDTFVTILYVLADDFCKANLSCDIRPGPNASLSRSEVITLAVLDSRDLKVNGVFKLVLHKSIFALRFHLYRMSVESSHPPAQRSHRVLFASFSRTLANAHHPL